MTLDEWLKKKPKGALQTMSFDIRVPYPTLHSIRNGRPAEARIAQLITDYTGEEVSFAELAKGSPDWRPPSRGKSAKNGAAA